MKLVLLLIASLARAEGPDFQVEVNPQAYDQKDFAAKDVKTGHLPARRKRPDALPEKKDREAVFACVPGLAGDVKEMDELDRDLLFVRAKTMSLEHLREKYPKIAEARLARLKKEAAKK